MAVRGTTPPYKLTFSGYDMTGRKPFVTIRQKNTSLTLTGDRLSVETDESGSSITFRLKQEETLRFAVGEAEVQVKVIDAAGIVSGTGIGKLNIEKALLERVISYADNTT